MPQPTSDGFSDLVRSNRKTRNAALLRATTELYVLDTDHSADQNRRFEELARHLLPEVGIADRAFVAEKLATIADAPIAVLRILARDVVEVAEPVILRSPALGAVDLLSTIAGTDTAHHELIARRSELPDEVRRALSLSIGHGGENDVTLTGEGDEKAKVAKPASLLLPDDFEDDEPEEEEHQDISSVDDGRSLLPKSTAAAWRFLGLEHAERLRAVAKIASQPVIGNGADIHDATGAFDRIVNIAEVIGYARARKTAEMISAIAEALQLSPRFVAASVNDRTGEPLAILLKALRLDEATAQMVFLLMSPVGRDVQRFFPLTDFFAGMEPVVAEAFVFEWRDDNEVEPAKPAARHEPLMPDVTARRKDRVFERPALPKERSDKTRRA